MVPVASDGDDDRGGRDHEDEEQDDDREEREEEQGRSVDVRTGDEGIEIRLERERAGEEDEVKISFEFEGSRFKVQFEREAAATERELELEARLIRLAEFRDTDGDGAFDPGEPVVSAWAFPGHDHDDEESDSGTVRWGAPTAADITVDGQPGKKIHAHGALGANGSFEMEILVFGDFVDLGNSTLEPTGAKIDFVIRHFPWREDGTAVALLLETRSATEFEVERRHGAMERDEEGVAALAATGNTTVALLFTWKDTATVDGATKPVATTTLRSREETERDEHGIDTERKERFALAYPRGEEIRHDPEAWVRLGPSDAGTFMPAPTAVAAAAALAVAFAVARASAPGRPR